MVSVSPLSAQGALGILILSSDKSISFQLDFQTLQLFSERLICRRKRIVIVEVEITTGTCYLKSLRIRHTCRIANGVSA